jgi:hypothetical protein
MSSLALTLLAAPLPSETTPKEPNQLNTITAMETLFKEYQDSLSNEWNILVDRVKTSSNSNPDDKKFRKRRLTIVGHSMGRTFGFAEGSPDREGITFYPNGHVKDKHGDEWWPADHLLYPPGLPCRDRPLIIDFRSTTWRKEDDKRSFLFRRVVVTDIC